MSSYTRLVGSQCTATAATRLQRVFARSPKNPPMSPIKNTSQERTRRVVFVLRWPRGLLHG